MYSSSKVARGTVLALGLALVFWGFGVPAAQARTAQQTCPSQQTQACVDPHAQHEADEARERALAKEQKEAAHAQHEAEEAKDREAKENEHAQHEAAEACDRQAKAYDHAKHEADEAQARASDKLDKANSLAGNMCKTTEPLAEVPPPPPPEPEVIRSKPEPEPVVTVPEPAPEPTPEPAPPVEKPKEMPRTASPLSLIGLIGLIDRKSVV